MSQPTVSMGFGPTFTSPVVFAYNRTGGALVAGDVVEFDIALSATETTGYVGVTVGTELLENDGLANVIAPTDDGTEFGIIGVVVGDGGGDNDLVKVQLRGIIDVVSVTVAGAATTGEWRFGVTASGGTDLVVNTGANSKKLLGFLLEPIAGASTVQRPFFFDGVHTIGTP